MESTKQQLSMLIEAGEKFTFQNFSQPNSAGREFGGVDSPQWLAWKTRSANIIKQAVSAESAPISLLNTGLGANTKGNYHDKFDTAKNNILEALRQTLSITEQDTFNELKKTTPARSSVTISNKIFVVHGHDSNLKVDLENFLQEIGLEPIVLHRQPDEGQTIIEKFEKHSDVGFAFILLTPDELAYTVDQEKLEDGQRKKEFRARPNVIFEFGYFVGKLGRKRVCCLYKGDVALPSDISGLLYKKIETNFENVGFAIIKELKAGGYSINL